MGLETAAIISLASVAATAGTTGASFAQAAKQKKIQRKAEADAQKYMADARKKLDVNFYEQLGIQKEPYELEREAALIQGARAIEAAVESERGAAATAGRLQLAQQQGQRQIAAAMGQEMLGLEKATAQEESRLRDMGLQLDLGEASGAQLKAREAETRAARAGQQAMQGVTSLAGQLAAAAPLFEKSASTKQFGDIASQAQDAGLSQQQFQQQLAAFGSTNPTFGNLAGVGAMDATKFQDFMIGLNPQYLKQLRSAFNPTGVYTSPIIGGQGLMGPTD
jgi:hypothetical protein